MARRTTVKRALNAQRRSRYPERTSSEELAGLFRKGSPAVLVRLSTHGAVAGGGAGAF